MVPVVPLTVRPVPRAMQLTKQRMWAAFDLDYTINDEGAVRVPLKWQAENLVTIKLPVPTKITTAIRVHKRAAPIFEAWFRSFDKATCEAVKTFDGSFVPRLMRLAKNLPSTANPTRDWNPFLSRHSRGIALDVNSKWNLQGKPGASWGQEGCLWTLIAKARDVRVSVRNPDGSEWEGGIVCGADWNGKHIDPTHFEVGSW